MEISNDFRYLFCLVWLVAKSWPTLVIAMDRSLPGSSVHGILQARILGWIAIPFSSLFCLGFPSIKLSQPVL